ncbi:MarR family EPS-associated transcriptional regulator [Parahaliea mediterranea]|uniref:MarR family EPS-associated transcriptional regulator n=2 Tax=Parahaliea mediterranea TaxID=651086 RepID=A0A939IJL3_9GAMM|nr:MarR family EPS-associated transcriptional regulator [Parahaliea mediterranea]MBN7797789.1 MarR family EPS-associated transcriptional regulator [Parahaliea mediterranea]
MRPSETHLRVMRLVEAQPDISQRQIARQLGLSVGRANYCLQALIVKGWLKMENFHRSENKARYAYLLTPAGMAAKTRLTAHFLKRKLLEYEELKSEISELKSELSSMPDNCG